MAVTREELHDKNDSCSNVCLASVKTVERANLVAKAVVWALQAAMGQVREHLIDLGVVRLLLPVSNVVNLHAAHPVPLP